MGERERMWIAKHLNRVPTQYWIPELAKTWIWRERVKSGSCLKWSQVKCTKWDSNTFTGHVGSRFCTPWFNKCWLKVWSGVSQCRCWNKKYKDIVLHRNTPCFPRVPTHQTALIPLSSLRSIHRLHFSSTKLLTVRFWMTLEGSMLSVLTQTGFFLQSQAYLKIPIQKLLFFEYLTQQHSQIIGVKQIKCCL